MRVNRSVLLMARYAAPVDLEPDKSKTSSVLVAAATPIEAALRS